MKDEFNDDDIRELLAGYRVSGPRPALMARIKHLMREEMQHSTVRVEAAEARVSGSIMLLSGLAVLLVLNLFYTFAVGTLLEFTLPSAWTVYVTRSLFWMPVAGATMLVGTLLVILFRLFEPQSVVARGGNA